MNNDKLNKVDETIEESFQTNLNETPHSTHHPPLRDVFKNTFLRICEESSANGLPNIVKNPNIIIKVFWLILFSAGSVASIYCMYIVYIYIRSSSRENRPKKIDF